MTIEDRTVTVKQLPQRLGGKQRGIFLREVESCMDVRHPRIVLDCSNVRQLDQSVVHLLFCCLEEAMKRNGDVKLAAVPPGAEGVLELTGANRLFDIHATTAEAVESFHQSPLERDSRAIADVRHNMSEVGRNR